MEIVDLWCDQAPSPVFSPLNRDNPLNRDTLNWDTTVLITQAKNSRLRLLQLVYIAENVKNEAC